MKFMDDINLETLAKRLISSSKARRPSSLILLCLITLFITNIPLFGFLAINNFEDFKGLVPFIVGSVCYLLFSIIGYILLKHKSFTYRKPVRKALINKLVDAIMLFYISILFFELSILSAKSSFLLQPIITSLKPFLLTIFLLIIIIVGLLSKIIVINGLNNEKSSHTFSMTMAIRLSGVIGGIGIFLSNYLMHHGGGQILITTASILSLLISYVLIGITIIFIYHSILLLLYSIKKK
jgi:hypothetical protein